MGFLNNDTSPVTVDVKKGGEEALKRIAAGLSATELQLLAKVAASPKLKALAFAAAKKYV